MPEPPANLLDNLRFPADRRKGFPHGEILLHRPVEGIPLGDKASAHWNKQFSQAIKDLFCETKDSPLGKSSFAGDERFLVEWKTWFGAKTKVSPMGET